MPREIEVDAANKKIAREMANIAGLQVVDTTAREWPEPMGSEAFIGIAGDFVRLVEPHTEADPVALLGTFIVAAGVLFSHEAYAVADGSRHRPTEFLLLVGPTGSGRKGTSRSRVMPLLERVEPGYARRVLSGLSTGEGLIKGLVTENALQLPENRRYLALLPEFASLLSVMKREGNTMSPVLRQAWDGDRLRVLTRKEPLDVDDVNLAAIAHITDTELHGGITATEKANGFANRFIPLAVRRPRLHPEDAPEVNLDEIAARLHAAIRAAKGRGRLQRDDVARALWANEYPRLTRERGGMLGALCGRAEAHVLRLSLIYALLDSASAIRREHLQAAIAFWDYSERSINHIFRGATGDPDGDKILKALASGSMTDTDLFHLFSRNRTGEWIQAKMAMLKRDGKVFETTKDGDRKKGVRAWGLIGRGSSNGS